jgi:hypothetical protein
MMQPASLNTKHPDRSFSEAFAMFQHHSMMDRASDEVDGDQPAPQPHPSDPVSWHRSVHFNCDKEKIQMRESILIDFIYGRLTGIDATLMDGVEVDVVVIDVSTLLLAVRLLSLFFTGRWS